MSTIIEQPALLQPLSHEELGQLKVSLPSLNVISYRGPGDDGSISTSLEEMARQLDTKIDWIALSGLPPSPDRRVTGFTFHQPEIAGHLLEGHAKSCASYLRPLLHSMPELAHFDINAFRSYRQLNELVATEALRVAGFSYPSLFWLHDYQMALVAPLLAIEAGVIVCHFWHVPWPDPEIMLASPATRELVEAMLTNKLLGFHAMEYASNFMNTVLEIYPGARVDPLKMEVFFRGTTTQIAVMPLGLDFAYWQRLSRLARPKSALIPKKHGLANQVVLGVDRLDPSKGVIEKLAGLQAFLETHPTWHRRFHYVQLAQLPAESPSESFDYAVLARRRAQDINERFRSSGWEPIVWIEGMLEHKELAAWYQAADVLTVTPVKDGLNLIAKEYVACREDEQGIIVLGKQAGCAGELSTGALVVDSLNPTQVAEPISRALSMEFEEKRRRMLSMRHVVGWNQLDDWALGFLRKAIACNSPAFLQPR